MGRALGRSLDDIRTARNRDRPVSKCEKAFGKIPHKVGAEARRLNPPKPNDKWPGRKEGTYAWYEIQDAVDYWREFEAPKIIYQVIQFSPSYALDLDGRFGNDKTFIIPTQRLEILANLNAPIMWWFNWRHLTHLKDEALSPMGYKMEQLPLANFAPNMTAKIGGNAQTIITHTQAIATTSTTILDWLRHEFAVEQPGTMLAQPHQFSADTFVAAVRKALPKSHKLSAADIARLKQEHGETVEPARRAARELLALEHRLSDLVNAAYGLTPEDVALMWKTAPPRMPFAPA